VDFDGFQIQLQQALSNPLPGFDAQSTMAPPHRMKPDVQAPYYNSARKGGVLVLFYPHEGTIKTVLIKRPEYDGVHSKQVAFPGGKHEEGDNSLIDTALREAHEEIGVHPSMVEVVGELSRLYIPPSNFLVTPVVAITSQRPNFILQEEEVAGILEPSLYTLLDDELVENHTIQVREFVIESPGIDIDGNIIWGATAMMIGELKVIVNSFLPAK